MFHCKLILVHGPNVAEDFTVAEDLDRAFVVKENPFPGQPNLAAIPFAVKKLFIVDFFLDPIDTDVAVNFSLFVVIVLEIRAERLVAYTPLLPSILSFFVVIVLFFLEEMIGA